MELKLDINDLTIDDVCDLEEVLGEPIQNIVKGEDTHQGKALKALIWIIKRREEPGYTLEDAGKEKFTSISGGDLTAEAEVDPPEAAG